MQKVKARTSLVNRLKNIVSYDQESWKLQEAFLEYPEQGRVLLSPFASS